MCTYEEGTEERPTYVYLFPSALVSTDIIFMRVIIALLV